MKFSYCQIHNEKINKLYQLTFTGDYPPGSKGTPFAQFIKGRTDEIIAQFSPNAIIFDFTKLNYEWGDGIISVLLIPLYKNKDFNIITCIVAEGLTFQSIKNLFDASKIDFFVKTKLFIKIDDALRYIEETNAQ